MLVPCASENKENRFFFYTMNVMLFIVALNTRDSNQNIAFMI
jgi:hypothetical protein